MPTKTALYPAPIVKCPHCKWQGSARGLFTHVRLAHPGISEKPMFQRDFYKNNLFNGPAGVSGIKLTPNDMARLKNPVKYAPLSKEAKADFLALAVVVPTLIYIFSQPDIKNILKSEGVNSKRVITALGKII